VTGVQTCALPISFFPVNSQHSLFIGWWFFTLLLIFCAMLAAGGGEQEPA
jgi:hypothetical protein